MNGTSHTLQCVFPAIALSEQAVIEVVILPNIALTGNRTNTATVYSADQADSVRDNNTDSATSQVEGVFDLRVTTEASTSVITPATEAAANSILSFVTHVSSIGLSTAPTAQAIIQFPANAEIIQITSTGGADSCVPAPASLAGTTGMSMTCQWNSGIPSGGTRDITYQVMVPNDVGNTISHQANVSLTTPGVPRAETDLTNNDASAQVSTPAGCTYDGSTNVVTCLIGALANGADYVVVLPVRLDSQVTPGQSITNTVITDLPTDPNPGNNQDDEKIEASDHIRRVPAIPQWALVILMMLMTVCAGIHQHRKSRSR